MFVVVVIVSGVRKFSADTYRLISYRIINSTINAVRVLKRNQHIQNVNASLTECIYNFTASSSIHK